MRKIILKLLFTISVIAFSVSCGTKENDNENVEQNYEVLPPIKSYDLICSQDLMWKRRINIYEINGHKYIEYISYNTNLFYPIEDGDSIIIDRWGDLAVGDTDNGI